MSRKRSPRNKRQSQKKRTDNAGGVRQRLKDEAPPPAELKALKEKPSNRLVSSPWYGRLTATTLGKIGTWLVTTFIGVVAVWIAHVGSERGLELTRQIAQRDSLYRSILLRPNIEMSFETDETGYGLQLRNVGLGPAEVKWARLRMKGHAIDNPVKRLPSALRYKPEWERMVRISGDPVMMEIAFPYSGLVYKPDEEKNLFWLSHNDEQIASILKTGDMPIDLELCYCSVDGVCEGVLMKVRHNGVFEEGTQTCGTRPDSTLLPFQATVAKFDSGPFTSTTRCCAEQ